MQSWLGKKLVDHMLAALRAGNPKPTLRMEARDVVFSFPGDSSWGGVHTGKKELRAWYERFCQAGLQIFADEVIVKGFPWRQTIAVRGTDHLDSADGERVYGNRYVIWGHMRWGRLKRYEVYEDTQGTAALDDWLERVGHPAAASATAGSGRRRLRRAA
ncbi:MAG TPA: nuclear transport factor 2 family protein [Solirubrobacteraceae bacterium]|nr:nuclear transport factor 2 family protein [Solirubrobacteraceae bacterium]